jgi:hypothetical protein
VHPNGVGNEMMAEGILPALGFTDAEVAQARDFWLDLPGTTLSPHANISLRQYLQLRAVAAKQGLTPEAMLDQMFNQDVQNLLVNPGSALKKSP